jgi:hypothetical protein
VHTPICECLNDADCIDDDGCTNDTCDGGQCVNTVIICRDDDPCTRDECDSAAGCVFPPLCGADEECAGGVCQPSACNGNGVCDNAESCATCPSDCPYSTGASCGNGICEIGNGEDCLSCGTDCNGRQSGRPGHRFCCGDGAGQNPVGCDDNRCTASGFECTEEPVGQSCCGDGACTGGESPASCSADCASAVPSCGDGQCSGSETSCSCSTDCGPGDAAESDCGDGADEDCDGDADCDDEDCAGHPECEPCLPLGAPCMANAECCSLKCSGPSGNKTCK